MRTIKVVLLILVAGCSPESPSLETSDKALPGEVKEESKAAQTALPSATTEALKAAAKLSIISVPRPNSGEFTSQQATKLLPEFLNRSVPLPASHEMITKWKSLTQGIRVHVNADETVEVVDFFGAKSVGAATINAALDSTMTVGNQRSVLLTSDTPGWETPVKQAVVSLLFQPSIQIYIVGLSTVNDQQVKPIEPSNGAHSN